MRNHSRSLLETRSILLGIWLMRDGTVKQGEYGVRELSRLTGLNVARVSRYLNRDPNRYQYPDVSNEIATKTEQGKWRYSGPPRADDVRNVSRYKVIRDAKGKIIETKLTSEIVDVDAAIIQRSRAKWSSSN